MSYRTDYEITCNLPQVAVQVFHELFPCYATANLLEVFGSLLLVVGFAFACYALLSVLFIRYFRRLTNGQHLVYLAGVVLFIVLTAFAVFYHSHSELAGLYSNHSPNVLMIEGTVSDLHSALNAKPACTSASFDLGGKSVEIFSNSQGFNNPLDPSIHNGAKMKLWLLKAPHTTRTIVLRMDTAELLHK